MGVRSLKDLDKIQEKGSILLSARRARTLVLGASCLVIAAFLVGLQVGRSLAPVEGKVVAQDVASADRTIEEILAAYRAEGRRPETAPVPEVAPLAESVTEAVEEVTVAEVAVRTEPRIVLPPPIPEVPVVPEVVVAEVITPAQAEPEVIDPLAGLPGPRTSGGYAVQLAAFPSTEEAAALVGVVEAAGARVYTMEVEVRGETWHRVRVGRFAGRSEAQAWIPMLTELTPFEPIVVTE
jgi:cell division septation protein DedD